MKAQINSFDFQHLTIGERVDFLNHVKDLIEAATPAALKIEEQATAFGSALSELSALVNRKTVYKATRGLNLHDADRDANFGVMCNVADAYETSPLDEYRAASGTLRDAFAPYRGMARHKYAKETTEIMGLLKVLKESDNAAAIEKLGLTDTVTALEEANEAFYAAMKGKAAEETERLPQSSLDSQEASDAVYALYKEIVQVVNAYAVVAPTDEITKFINDVNGYVNVYARLASGGTPSGSKGESDRPVLPDEDKEPVEPEEPTDPDEGGEGEDDRPVIPEEPEGEDKEPGKDENGDDLPEIE